MRRIILLAALVSWGTAHATSLIHQAPMSCVRVAGETQIAPDDAERVTMEKAGARIVATFKLCIDAKGSVARIDKVRGSGYAGYDDKLRRGLRTWKYRPPTADGKSPLCGAVTFVYTPKPKPRKFTA